MNHIDVKNIKNRFGYTDNYWIIDGVSLPEWLDKHLENTDDKYVKSAVVKFDELYPAWNHDIEFKGDVRFVWELIGMEKSPLPILLCPDDTDFSCIVIVVDVEKTKDFVYWNRVGYVKHDNEDFNEEKQRGILYVEAYSDEDWDKYGDNIACEEVDSSAWREWIGKNWEEELYRRRMNYTLPYYQTEGNIKWIIDTNWIFDRQEYEKMVCKFKEMQSYFCNKWYT